MPFVAGRHKSSRKDIGSDQASGNPHSDGVLAIVEATLFDAMSVRAGLRTMSWSAAARAAVRRSLPALATLFLGAMTEPFDRYQDL